LECRPRPNLGCRAIEEKEEEEEDLDLKDEVKKFRLDVNCWPLVRFHFISKTL
jgi:hypothetical protein